MGSGVRYYVDIPKPIRRWVDQKCPGNYRQRIKQAIQSLSTTPYPPDTEQLSPPLEKFYSLHIDHYRIVYAVDEDKLIIKIAFVGTHGTRPYSELDLL